MSRHRDTNPHFRPPPNQDQQSLLPTPPPGVATTPRHLDHQNQGQGQGQHSQLPIIQWFPQQPIQDQHTPGSEAKKPSDQPLHEWSKLKQDPEIQQQHPRWPRPPPSQGEHSDPPVTELISQRKQLQHHQAPSRAAEIPPLHQDRSNGSRVPPNRSTKFLTWFLASFCAIFWIVIILGGLIVLIIYLLFRPHSPRFDVSSVTLNAAYLDVGALLNADLTVLANFTNPNKKVKIDFSYVVLDLYYGKTLIASQYVEPFKVASRTSWFTYVRMVTSQVRLPLAETERLKKEIDSNAIVFQVNGVFRARSKLGSVLGYSYWLYSHCTIELSDPPSGVIRARRCRTKR